jgi:toxin ParE1/3/4
MIILWTDPSLDDLRAIRDYIAKDSETYAESFVESILLAVERLNDFPRLGRVVPEADASDIREVLFRSYRILYRVQEDAIHILSVIHGYRDISAMSPKPWEA